MGPINWLAVVLAAAVAGVLCPLWYRAWGLRGPQPARLAALIVPALLMGHNFARLSADLPAKPKLYWMMSGGFALAVVIPAQFIAYGRHSVPAREAWADALWWLVGFLAMGTVFWALR